LVGGSIGEEVGRALRRTRLARGLTLKEVGELSAGAFKPTAVAGYERAERNISLERYCEICGVYGVGPAELLAATLEAIAAESDVIIDLTHPEDATTVFPG
jgi:transcriptional regulator with XRE-family HTH domain